MADKLPPGHGADAHKDKMGKVMHEWKHGTLHSGTGKKGKKGPVVKNRQQAIAIGISESKHAERLIAMGYSEEAASAIADFIESQRAAEDADEGPLSDVDSTPGKQKGSSGRRKQNDQELQATFPTVPHAEGAMIRARKGSCPPGTKPAGAGFCRNPKAGKREYFDKDPKKGCPPGSRTAGKGKCSVDFADPAVTAANAVKGIENTPCSAKKKKDPNAPKKEEAKPTTPTAPTQPNKPETPETQMVKDAAKKRAEQCSKQTGN